MKWTATTTLQEIKEDNKKLRTEKKVIQEKSFDILFDKPPIDMHENTSLVFVDIPGLNEADTKMMYLDYIRDHWDSFDCVIIVMDAEKGASTQEEVKLLEFAKKMLATKKQLPIIILCNKVDDPDDASLMDLVHELRKRAQKVFGVADRTEALEQMLTAFRQGQRVNADTSVFPIFIPISAGNAFAYRAGANCSFEKFQQLDSKLIDTIGCDELGVAKWKPQSKANKYKIAFQAINDATQFQERLATTNFDTFLSALAYTLGGSETQRDLLHQQTKVAVRHLSDGPIIANQLVSVYNTCQILNRYSGHLKAAFWNEFKERSEKAYEIFPTEINVSHFNPILDELIAYSDFVRQAEWNEEEEQKIVCAVETLVRSLIGSILERESVWKIDLTVLARYPNYYEWNGQQWKQQTPPTPQHPGYYNPPPAHANKASPPVGYPWHWKAEENRWRNVHTSEYVEGVVSQLVHINVSRLGHHSRIVVAGIIQPPVPGTLWV